MYTLIMVNMPLPRGWRVMNYARPSIRVPCVVMNGAVALSTRMAVPTLILCERPIGMPSFQKELSY